MLSYVHYKENLDLIDKFDVEGVNISNSLICNNFKIVHKKKREEYKKGISPLVAAVLGLNNTAAPRNPPLARKPQSRSLLWTDVDVLQRYLDTLPTCYLILGKPGCGAYNLGETFAKKFNCIHLCPLNVLIDEIEQNSPTGKCIDFNMRHNNVCKIDTILPIIKRKIQSPVVQHRGYIISGLPLVTSSRDAQYLFNTLYGEESVSIVEETLKDWIINDLNKKKTEKRRDDGSSSTSLSSVREDTEENQEEEHEDQQPEETEEEEESPVALPKLVLESCVDIIHCKKAYLDTKKAVLLNQLNELFNLQLRPDIIIYITIPDGAMITKKSHKYFNYKSNLNTTDPFIPKPENEIRWPARYVVSDYISPYDNQVFNPKYNCRHPINFTERATEQLCNYKHHISSFIDSKLKDFNPRYVIKVDGRSTVHEMMHNVTERLHMTPIVWPVVIPKPLYLENPSEDLEEFWKSVEELNVIRSGRIRFNRYASPWFNRCPVELKERHTIRGKPKFAVTFFKHVYLLSSLNALISFCLNPRPYLKIYHLEPICRVIVMGTKSSGKTMVSECLSWIFEAPIISFEDVLKNERKKKYNSFSKTILSEIIATIEDNRLANWQRAEADRTSKLTEWLNSNLIQLKKYVPLLAEHIKQKQLITEIETDPAFLKNFNTLKSKLYFLPFLDYLEQCSDALVRKNIMQYAPSKLLKETKKPETPVLGDYDVTNAIKTYIESNELEKEIEPTPEEIMNEIIKNISEIDTQAQKASKYKLKYGKYVIDGFPSDPEFWRLLNDAKLLPDNTIALIENRDLNSNLIKHYMKLENSLKNYQERFVLVNDPLMRIKLETKKPSDTPFLDIQMIIQNHLDETLESTATHSEESDNDEFEIEFMKTFNQSMDRFREEWDTLKVKLEDNFKSFIEIELGGKTDIEVIEEVLLKFRQCYCKPCEVSEGQEEFDIQDEEEEAPKNLLTYNQSKFLCDVNIYCPVAYYDHSVLWEGKPEISLKLDNKMHYFSKEECLEVFRKDSTKYQSYNKPYKSLPPLRICVIGCGGSGRTTVAKLIAKELGLLCIDIIDIINNHIMPRHFKKVGINFENMFTDIPLDEEAVVDFQIAEENENLVSDILSSETELRRMVHNYFERGTPMISALMQKILKKLWVEDPFSTTGFVIDGFPRLPSDVEDMVACFCIPDLIIELESSMELAVKHQASNLLHKWKTQQAEARLKAKKKFMNVNNEWDDFITKKVVIKIIYDEIIDNACSHFIDEMAMKPPSTASVIIDAHPSGSPNVDTNLFTTYNEMIQEFPEPLDETEWEKPDDARERIYARLEAIYETEEEGLQALRDIVSEQRIKLVAVDATKPLHKVTRVALSKLSNLRHRDEAFFEQTFVLNYDMADVLLSEGFCFLSRFNRVGPVYLYDHPNTVINVYKVGRQKGTIFPVIHRSYIYFINGEGALKKFRSNPLKYIANDNILSYHEYSLRIGVIGSPKSGKSLLAAKLAKRYGLLCVSKGMAVRNILEKMHWTKLASVMREQLSAGQCIDRDHIIRAVQSVLIDHRTFSNGFVLDGFPESPSEVVELEREGIYPVVVFDLSADKNVIMENSQNENHLDILKIMPPYSRPFIEYKYTKWSEQSGRVRDYINKDIQNLVMLNANGSHWKCLQQANLHIYSILPKIHYYLHHVKSTIVPAGVLGISNHIFQQRMSCFKNMCPVCLCKNVLRHNAYPVDKTGVVEYKSQYYWICPEHMPEVLKHPDHYLNAISVDIPQIPAVVKNVNLSLVYEHGVCIVHYAENLPAQIIQTGTNKFAASYKGRRYLFCSAECHEKFLAKPHMYFDIVVFKETRNFPPINLNKLPVVGYLEQTVGNILTEACCAVNVLRPKYPGLTIEVSALLFIGLYLKIHNDHVDPSTLSLYKKAFKVYESRSKLLINVGLRLRAVDNPFANYPKCCQSLEKSNSGTVCKPHSLSVDSTIPTPFQFVGRRSADSDFEEDASRVPVPDERFDFLCEYHKPVSKVPAFLNVVDIAGLVRGAAEGQGLGNAFLSHIKACDAIFNLCRAFDDEDVIHVDGDVNPVRDLETIGEELRLKDEEQLLQHLDKLDRVVNRGGDKKLKPEYDALMKIKTILVEEKKHIRFGDWSAADIEVLNKYLFLTSKPALYLVNLSEKDYIRKKNKWLPKLKEWIDKNDPGAPLIPFSGVLENKLLEMDAEEKKNFLKEHGITSALDKIIVQGYKALQLEYFFTAGPDEVKAWTIQKGTKAPQAAGRIHTDFEKGFIMAEVMHFKDFKEEGSEAACKAAGKYRQQGRNYVVEDGDIIFFKFNAGAGLKDAKKK